MRYVGQEYTLTIPLDRRRRAAAARTSPRRSPTRFHDAHETRFGHANPGAPVELVVVRTTALGDLGRAEPARLGDRPRRRLPAGTREAVFDGRVRRDATFVHRADLAPGAVVEGPAIITEHDRDHGRAARARRLASTRSARSSITTGRGRAMSVETAAVVDPITTEIIRSAFKAAADEMNATLIRSAYTPVIYEMKDCSVALLDADHRILGQSAGLPIFLGNLEICTRLTEEMYGRASLAARATSGSMNDSLPRPART